MDYLFVGLGNPGKEYEKTRHNAGFLMIDKFAQKFGCEKFNENFSAHFQKIIINSKNIILLKPQSFINLSGSSVLKVLNFYKLSTQRVWVFYDDLDLDTARIKIKIGGSSGGHNGIKSIDSHIGIDYWRFRIGINQQLRKDSASDYVLKNFSKLEMDKINKIMDNVVDNVELLLNDQKDKFLNKIIL